MNLASVFNWTGFLLGLFLSGYALDTYMFRFEWASPSLIFPMTSIILMQAFAKCKIGQGTYVALEQKHTPVPCTTG